MKARQAVAAVGAAALLGGCAAAGYDPPAPAYGVVRQDRTSVDLLVRDATIERSKSVISTWLAANAGSTRYLTVTVLNAADAGLYICRAEFVADAETAQAMTNGRVTGPYPATAFDCPAAGG